MKLPTSRTVVKILIAVGIFLIVISKDLLIQIVGVQVGEYIQKNFGISTRTLIYVLISVLLLSCFLAIRTALKNKDEQEEPRRVPQNIERNVERFVGSLKKRYQSRYEQKLDERFEITLDVSKNWSSLTPQVSKEKFTHKANIGEAAEVINQTFSEKGGLLIVGNPGAGKTVLLLKLAISLLDRIDLAGKDAFPVIFNLASWSTKYERFEEWLKVSLESGYGLSKDFAGTLLHQERIIFLLDGLDELARNDDEKLAAETRGKCLQSLNQYLSRGKQVVICCRRDEFVLIQELVGHVAPVAVTVALCDLTKNQIENALSAAEHRKNSKGYKPDAHSARHILEFLQRERSKVLLDTLRTPFYFTTALEVFDRPILDDHQIPNDPVDLKKYLLDKFVDTKLRADRTPNPGNFKPEKTTKWLKALARELEFTRSIDFELSSLQPDSLSNPWVYQLLHGLVSVVGILLCFGWIYGLIFGLYVLFKLLDASYLGSGKYEYIQTEDIQRINVANLFSRRKLKRGLVYGLVSGSLACLIFNLRNVSAGSLVAGSIVGLFIGVQEIVREVSYFVNVKTPYQRLKTGFIRKAFILALVGLLMNALSLYVSRNESELVLDNKWLLFLSFFGGAIIGFSMTPLFRHLILRLCLYLEGAAPLKYATFLNYAAAARILETDGGQWRFRHQNLQTYFADMKRDRFTRIIES